MRYNYETATLQCTFTDDDSNNVDPTTVKLLIVQPDGVELTYTYALGEITKSATGVYLYYFHPTQLGTHIQWWKGTTTTRVIIESLEFVVHTTPTSLA